MKKNNIFKTLLLSFLVSGCVLNSNSTNNNTNTNASTGGTPNKGEFGYSEIKDLFEKGYENFTAHDGVSVKLANSSISFLMEEFSYTNDQVDGKFEGHIEAKDVNLDIKLKGLKNATKVNDFDAAVVASGDLHVFEVREGSELEEDEEATRDLAKGDLDAAIYFENGKLYTSINEFYKNTLLDPIYPDNFYFDLGLEGVEEMLEEMTGFAFPVLSETNIEAIKGMIDESMKDFDFEQSFGMKEETIDTFVTYLLTDLFTVNKEGSNYYLNLNLTKANLVDECLGVVDKLYETGMLQVMFGTEEAIPADEYKEFKEGIKLVVEEYSQNFNHVKLSVVFTEEMVKSVSVDTDFKFQVSEGYVGNGEEMHLNSRGFVTLKAKLNYEFDYSDNVNITFPNFDSYVDYEEYFSYENIAKYINDAAATDEPFDSSRVYSLLGNSVTVYDGNTITFYPGYNDTIDLALAMKNGESIESITVVFTSGETPDDPSYASSATYNATSAPVTFETWELLNYVYDHTYDELVALFGTPYQTNGEPTDEYSSATWMMDENRGFEVYFEYGYADGYSYIDIQYDEPVKDY